MLSSGGLVKLKLTPREGFIVWAPIRRAGVSFAGTSRLPWCRRPCSSMKLAFCSSVSPLRARAVPFFSWSSCCGARSQAVVSWLLSLMDDPDKWEQMARACQACVVCGQTEKPLALEELSCVVCQCRIAKGGEPFSALTPGVVFCCCDGCVSLISSAFPGKCRCEHA